jgi:putative ABC transport system permease protein
MMRFFVTVNMALRALRRNTMRSILTALGIIIGVGAVIAMVSIGNGAKAQVQNAIAGLGDNLIIISPQSMNTGGVRGGAGTGVTLIPADADAIVTDLQEGGATNVMSVSPYVGGGGFQLLANGLNWRPASLIGVGPDWPDIRSWRVAEGNFFGEDDVKAASKVCVIGRTVADTLFPEGNAIGQMMRIGSIPFKIIGIMDVKGYNNNQDQDDVVLLPYKSHMTRLSRRTNVNSIYVKARNEDVVERVKSDLTDLMTQRHNGVVDFQVQDQAEIAALRNQATTTMTYLLGAIAGVSLLVGGIGIMNIMLVSVTERTREIGIRLALGAHGKDVLTQFLIEAILLSSLGGMMGVALGIGGSTVAGKYAGWAVEPSTPAMVIAVVFSSLVGVFFGFYPARKAAAMDPIEALRYE